MLECIKFGDFKIKTIQIESEWFVSVRHIGIALGVSFDTLKGIVLHHLPQQYKFSRKEINIDDPYDGSIDDPYDGILGSKHPEQHDVLDFLVERHDYLQDQAWEVQNKRHAALDNSISTAKNYRKHIYSASKLGEPALL